MGKPQIDATHFTELNYKELIHLVSHYFRIVNKRGKFGFIKNRVLQKLLGRWPIVC